MNRRRSSAWNCIVSGCRSTNTVHAPWGSGRKGLGQHLLCSALLCSCRVPNSNLLSPRCRGSIVAAIEPLEQGSRSHLDSAASTGTRVALVVWVLLEVPRLYAVQRCNAVSLEDSKLTPRSVPSLPVSSRPGDPRGALDVWM